MDVLFNDTAKVSTESEAQAPQADSYSTTTDLLFMARSPRGGYGACLSGAIQVPPPP